ncbi:MAG: flagellar biosynthetic protein FliO [Pseudomonadota bacterium]
MITNIAQYIASFIFVMALIAITAWMLKRFLNQNGIPSIPMLKAKNSRLQILEVAIVDTQRRLVLVRRDDVEHLIMTGGTSELVIESDIPHKKDGDNEDDLIEF